MELLVVIGIIALLVGILLPALSKARKQANTVKCLAQHKQLMMAFILYSNEWKGSIPWSNGNGHIVTEQPYPGWLYDVNRIASTKTWTQNDVQTGVFWDILGDVKAYRCPEDGGPWSSGIQVLTSYCYNRCLAPTPPGAKLGAWSPTYFPSNLYKITDFQGGTVAFWEFPASGNFVAINDACNDPYEGIAVRHNKGATLSFIDGHAETWTLQQYMTEVNLTGGRDGSALWRAPNATNGGHTAGSPTYISQLSNGKTPAGNVVPYSE